MIRSGKALRRWLVLAVIPILAWLLCGCAGTMNAGNSDPPLTPRRDAGVTIVLEQGKDPNPKFRKVWRSRGEDHVRWENRSTVARTIKFQTGIWPFEEDQAPIIVPARGRSQWFTIGGPGYTTREYTYKVDPPVKDSGPPGDPDISGGD